MAGAVALAAACGGSTSSNSSDGGSADGSRGGSGSGSSSGGGSGSSSSSSSSSSGGSGSCSGGHGGTAPPADAFIAAVVGGGPDCPFPSPVTNWLSVGTTTAAKPTTVVDQGSTGSGTACIDCTVHPEGAGFDIALSLSVAGDPGGSVTITSPQGAGAVSTSGGAGITASFYDSTDPGPFSSSSCTITFTYMGQPVPVSPAVAAGRIWGHIDCPDATESGQTAIGPDGGATARACAASADFLFEQCLE